MADFDCKTHRTTSEKFSVPRKCKSWVKQVRCSGPKDLDLCFFDKCLSGVAQSTSRLLRRVTPALLRSLRPRKNQQMFFLGVCVAEDPANRTREEKKRFRSRQTASKQGTNHSDSYSRRIDLPRSNAVAREARTFAYVPLVRLTQQWSEGIDRSHYIGALFFDLKKPSTKCGTVDSLQN